MAGQQAGPQQAARMGWFLFPLFLFVSKIKVKVYSTYGPTTS
jgi:hypothetical protein